MAPDRSAPHGSQAGMTLVEVLVAMAILAMVAVAVLGLIGQNTRFMASTEARLMAGIVADNLMVERLAQKSPLDRGEQQGRIELGGRTWLYRQIVTDPEVEGLVRIEIEVRREESEQLIASATTLKKE